MFAFYSFELLEKFNVTSKTKLRQRQASTGSITFTTQVSCTRWSLGEETGSLFMLIPSATIIAIKFCNFSNPCKGPSQSHLRRLDPREGKFGGRKLTQQSYQIWEDNTCRETKETIFFSPFKCMLTKFDAELTNLAR